MSIDAGVYFFIRHVNFGPVRFVHLFAHAHLALSASRYIPTLARRNSVGWAKRTSINKRTKRRDSEISRVARNKRRIMHCYTRSHMFFRATISTRYLTTFEGEEKVAVSFL